MRETRIVKRISTNRCHRVSYASDGSCSCSFRLQNLQGQKYKIGRFNSRSDRNIPLPPCLLRARRATSLILSWSVSLPESAQLRISARVNVDKRPRQTVAAMSSGGKNSPVTVRVITGVCRQVQETNNYKEVRAYHSHRGACE